MCSSTKFVYFGKCSKFSTDSFLFFGLSYSSPHPHPTPPFSRSVVWTNCVALCPLSQYKKISPPPPCLSFQTSTDSMCIFECKRKHVCIFFKRMGSGHSLFFFHRFNLKRMKFRSRQELKLGAVAGQVLEGHASLVCRENKHGELNCLTKLEEGIIWYY